jgi:glycosidase
MTGPDRTWWKEAVVYQLYPQSFDDSDGDGVGDIAGIRERVGHLDDLGVDVVWCNPLYASPHVDDGYDISDYREIREEYGTMAEFEGLLADLHERDMKLVMDLVVNHTSDEHEWFERSKDPESEYHDYYHWVEAPPDDPPSNWTSGFGGSAWAWDEAVGKWYLHLFHERQPDLNWENPTVRAEVFDMMNWWLDKGIDGFRMDVINLISKPEGYPDGDPEEGWVGIEQFAEGPRVHEYLYEMSERVFADRDVFTIGETIGVDVAEADRYAEDGLDTVFHFDHVTLDFDEEDGWWSVRDWALPELKDIWGRWQTHPRKAWPSAYLGNHDWPRTVSRWGDEEYRYESATALGTLVLASRGTPFVYQGEEIGMTNYPFDSMDELRDADATNRIREAVEAGDIEGFEEVRDLVRYRSRDNARTPMQWDASEGAGFTDGEPWIGVNPNHEWLNVAADRAAEASVFEHFRRLIELRHAHDALVYGEYDDLLPDHGQAWLFTRTLGDERFLIALNLSGKETTVEVPERGRLEGGEAVVWNYGGVPDGFDASLDLRPYEARVYRADGG